MGDDNCLPGIQVPSSNGDGQQHDNDDNEGSFGPGHGCILLYEGSNIADRVFNCCRLYTAFSNTSFLNLPVLTRTPRIPAACAPPISVRMSSPIITTPNIPSPMSRIARSKNAFAGFPTTVAVLPVADSRAVTNGPAESESPSGAIQ